MLPSLTELILLIVIMLCIFGLGKIGDISEFFGELRAGRTKGLPAEDAVDITPEHERRTNGTEAAPKPGAAEQPVDEAVVGDETSERPSKT